MRVSRTLGYEHLYVAAPGPRGAVIRLAIPLVQVSVALKRLEAGIFGVGLLALLLTAVLSLGFSVAITRRLRRLVRAARTMAGGDLTLRIRSPSDDELGELAEALDALAEELQGRLAELERERAETQALIDAMSEGVLGLSRAGTVDRANPAARSIFSLPAVGHGLAPEAVRLWELVAEAWEPCRETAEDKGGRLVVQIDPECELVLADASALRQVFANLFSNSIRHLNRGGTVRVTTTAAVGPSFESAIPEAGRAQRRWVRVSVQDTGAGIPSAHLPRIFERFYRADAARARADGGTGLGLAIVKHLVEQHGGTVQAESRLGEGTTIRFTLPAARGGELREDAA